MQRDRRELSRTRISRRLLRLGVGLGLALLALPILYVLAAVAGAVLPRNAGWHEPDAGVGIFIRTNGVHSDLVLPATAAGVDWYRLMPPAHVPEPSEAAGWIAIGWGQREFLLETPRWADLRATTALHALTGGAALMHVQHGPRPRPSATHRPLRIDPEGYRRMAGAIRASFALDERGRPRPLLGRGYGDDDVFYEARERYHALRTSNQWTADMLAEAGVEIGVWTPFEQSVMWRFQ